MHEFSLIATKVIGIDVNQVIYEQNPDLLEVDDKEIERIVIHHAGSQDYSISKLISHHVGNLKWGAIGYHFVIDRDGAIYYTRNLHLRGGHSIPNAGKIGICLLGSCDSSSPNEQEMESLKRILKVFYDQFKVDVVTHSQDQVTELLKKYPQIAKEELWDCWKNHEQFHIAKARLSNFYPDISEIKKLKICPGVNFYKEIITLIA